MDYLVSFALLSIPMYLVLQVITSRRETGERRKWALLPAPFMALMAVLAFVNLLLGVPGWSLWLTLTAPFAFLYQVVFMTRTAFAQRDFRR